MASKSKTHGLHGLMARVKGNGMSGVDRRTAPYKAVMSWRQQLLQDLGGEANVSSQRMVLVDLAVRTKLFVDHVDAFLVRQKSLVNQKRRSVYPVVRERLALADSLARLLSQLGLERVPRPVEDLQTYLRRKAATQDEPSNTPRTNNSDDEEPEEIERD